MTVATRLHIEFPAMHWQRLEIVRFTNPASPFYGVLVMLGRRDRILEGLRARGYAVRDDRGA
jgi:hypothetical protein